MSRKSHAAEKLAAFARGPARQSTAKKLFFSLAVTVAFFVFLEWVLIASGVRPLAEYVDPYVGFSSYLPLFVEPEDGNGSRMTTAQNKLPWFNEQSFPKKKAPDAYRIFCLGGSTTYGRPYDDRTSFCGWLREFLWAADGSKRWEVVNAGGISYAAYRVAKVVEELIEHEPDLFIIYTGHNEFLEARTYGHLRETPSSVRNFLGLLSHTRTYSAMARFIRAGRWESNRADFPTDRELLPAEVKTLLDSAVGPEVYHRDEQLRRRILVHFEFNLNRMLDLARSVGADVVFVTPTSNLRDCSPFKSQHRDGLKADAFDRWRKMYDRAREKYAQGELDGALSLLDEAATLDDRYADSLYLRGRVLFGLKRYAEAKADLMKARDEDVCPLRAPTEIGDLILKVAAERNVPVIDFAARVERLSPQQIPGKEFFLDHVHPTVDGHRRLALAILQRLVSRRVVHLDAAWGEPAIREVTERVEGRIDRTMRAAALTNLSKVLSWAGKAEEADRAALRAVELAADDAQTQYQAANAVLRRGNVDEAIAHYQRALELDPTSAQTHYGLALAWTAKGDTAKTISHYQRALDLNPDFGDAHYNLANMFLQQNDLERAALYYAAAIRSNPQDYDARVNLGIVLARQGKIAAARARFEEAVRINPRSAVAHASLGEALEKLGERAAAVHHYREALRHDPDHATAAERLRAILKNKP